MIPPAGKVPVSKKMVEAALQMFRSKAELQKKMLDTHVQWSVSERKVITFFLESQGFTSNPVYAAALKEWQENHKAKNDAEEDLMRVSLAELNSQVKIHEAMLEQGGKLVQPVGPGVDFR